MPSDFQDPEATGNSAFLREEGYLRIRWDVGSALAVLFFLYMDERIGEMVNALNMIVVGVGKDHICDSLRLDAITAQRVGRRHPILQHKSGQIIATGVHQYLSAAHIDQVEKKYDGTASIGITAG